jgi:hypothetical protein
LGAAGIAGTGHIEIENWVEGALVEERLFVD